MSAALDLSKPVQTRDGRKVRILCTDARGIFTVIGLILGDEHDEPESWTLTGRCYGDCSNSATDLDDLINVPERAERWVNAYPLPAAYLGAVNLSRAEADGDSGTMRAGVLRITYEDGKPVAVALEAV